MANLQGTHFQYSRFNNGNDPSPRAKDIINTSKEQRKSLIQADNILHYSIHGSEPTHPEIKEIINPSTKYQVPTCKSATWHVAYRKNLEPYTKLGIF